MYYIGLDVHKKTISYCMKDAAGKIQSEGKIGSTRRELDAWIKTLPQPRMMAMEATIFTGWIYDHLLPHAEKVTLQMPKPKHERLTIWLLYVRVSGGTTQMTPIELGKLQRVELREVWKHEAVDFTPWLVENIDVIGELLGLDLEVVGREQSVGDFAVDILARDLGRDKGVIIENQLDETDHTHLGQLITYAAGLEAGVVVWVSRKFREEHRQALDWLNRGGGASTEYFGVVVELLQIDNSKPAVNLRLIASPNNWSRRTILTTPADDPSGKYARYQQFFQRLIDDLREKHRFTNARVGQPQNWYSFSTGTRGFQYGLSFANGGRMRAELYIDFGESAQNVGALDALAKERSSVEAEFGESLEWDTLEGRRACRIAIYRQGTIEDSAASLEEYHKWAIDRLLRFKKVFSPRLPAAARSAEIPKLVDLTKAVSTANS